MTSQDPFFLNDIEFRENSSKAVRCGVAFCKCDAVNQAIMTNTERVYRDGYAEIIFLPVCLAHKQDLVDNSGTRMCADPVQ